MNHQETRAISTKSDVRALLRPSNNDVPYVTEDELKISLICRIDSYKFSHPYAYPDDLDLNGGKIIGMTSYGTARVPGHQTIVPAGMQILAKRYLSQTITMADVDAAEAFAIAHFGRPLFARAAWEKVVTQYGGHLPLTIRAVPEGTPIRGGHAIYTVTVLDDEDLFWMSAGFETMIQRGIWYPTTIATMDYEIKREIKRFYDISGGDMTLLPFALHDFGGRGVTCAEQAEIGGAAHLFNFMGSDTVEGVLAANFFYKCDMAAFSVYATEHSIQCSFGGGREDAIKYIKHQLRKAKELGVGIVSIVLDGYDVYREAEICCTDLKQDIIDCGAKVVFRPDSGDMLEVVPRILKLQAATFGTEAVEGMFGVTYQRIKHVGIIQGDGVDHMAIKTLLGNIIATGFAASCVIFGSGGALLQKVNRDTFKFAQKACAILVRHEDGSEEWIGIAKNPVTDPGKKSQEGVLTLVRSRMNNEYMNARLDLGPLDAEWIDQHKLVYHLGQLYNETTLTEIRLRLEL